MRFTPLNVAAVLLLGAGTLRAQGADVVRGRVLDDSSRALVGASIVITRGPDRLVQSTVTAAKPVPASAAIASPYLAETGGQ